MPKPPTIAPQSPPAFALSEIGAIAVDVSTYQRLGWRLRSPPLAALASVGQWALQVLVPEVWDRELRKHLQIWAQQRLAEVRHAAQLADWGTGPQEGATRAFEAAWSPESCTSLADRLLVEHFQAVKAKRLTTAWSTGPAVLDAYFEAKYPFEPSGPKKSEFPDAFALATLRHWSAKQGKKVIVVSADQGCRAACADVSGLLAFPTLAEAFAALAAADQDGRRRALQYEQAIARELVNEVSPLRKTLDALLERQLQDMEVIAECDNEEDCEAEVDDVTLLAVLASNAAGLPQVSVITHTAHRVSFTWAPGLKIEVEARFSRSRMHRDTWARRPSPVRRRMLWDAEVFITLETPEPISPEGIANAQVVSLDISERSLTVPFGDVDLFD